MTNNEISFGGIPNSSSLMPCVTTWAHSCSAVVFAHADNVITKRCSKTITWLFLSRLQGDKPLLNLPKPWNSPPAQTGTLRNLRNLPPEPTPAHIGILLPEPASGTYTTTHRDFPEGQALIRARKSNSHVHTKHLFVTFTQIRTQI